MLVVFLLAAIEAAEFLADLSTEDYNQLRYSPGGKEAEGEVKIFFDRNLQSAPCTSTSSTGCSSCADGLYLIGDKCASCVSPCQNCTDSTTCDICVPGFFVSNSTCLECSKNCKSCLTQEICTECESLTFLQSGKCEECVDSFIQAVIAGPSEFSLNCSELGYSGMHSIANYIQPVSYFWEIAQYNQSNHQIFYMNSTSRDISVSGLQRVFSTLSVKLTINNCGKSSSASISTSIIEKRGLVLGINNGNHIISNSAAGIYLTAILLNSCGNAGELSWKWSGAFSGNSENLYIGDSTLAEGNYEITLTGSTALVSTSMNLTITIAASPIIISFSRSSGIASASENFTISAIKSYDSSSPTSSLSYTWSCYNTTKKCTDRSGNELKFNSNPIFYIDQRDLKAGLRVYVRLLAENGAKSSTQDVVIDFQNSPVAILEQASYRVNPTETFRIKAALSVSGNLTWKCEQLPGVALGSWPILAIKAGTLTREIYNFEAYVNNAALASVTVYVNSPPQCKPIDQSWDSGTFGNILNLISPDCFDVDFPVLFSINHLTPQYSKINISAILPIGLPYKLTFSVCDTYQSCSSASQDVTVRSLQLANSKIDSTYAQIKSNYDLIPLSIIAFASSVVVSNSTYLGFLGDLSGFSSFYSHLVTPILAALQALTCSKQSDAIIGNSIKKILDILDSLEIDESLAEINAKYLMGILSNLARLKSSSLLNTTLSLHKKYTKVLTKSLAVNETFLQSSSDFLFYKTSKLGSNFPGFSFTSSSVNMSLPSIPLFNSSDIINLYLTSYKGKGNYSDIIDLTFTRSGNYSKNSISVTDEVIVPLKGLKLPIAFQVRYQKPAKNEWACAYFSSSQWYSDGCKFLSNTTNSISFTANHTTMFSLFDISEVKLPPPIYIPSDSSCGRNYNGIWILVVIIFLLIIIFPLLWLADKANWKDLNTYNSVKKDEQPELSASSRSYSEELPSNPNLSSDYAIQYRPKRPKVSKNCCELLIEGHLLLGIFVFRTEFNRVFRIIVLFVVLSVELLIEGLLLLGFQDTSKGQSGSVQGYFSEYRDKYFGYTILALLITDVMQIALILLFSLKGKMRKFGIGAGIVLCIVFFLASVSGVAIMATKFCPNWSGYWGISFLFGAIVEIVVVQTIFMLVRFCIVKCCYNPQ